MIWFGLAAGCGAVLRYLAHIYFPNRGIFWVNVVGSLLAGVVIVLVTRVFHNPSIGLIVIGGFAGSLTTYATVAVIAAQQAQQHLGKAVKTWLLHLGGSIVSCGIGILCACLLCD